MKHYDMLFEFASKYYSSLLSSGSINDFASYSEGVSKNSTPEEQKKARARAWLKDAIANDLAIDSIDMESLSERLGRDATRKDKMKVQQMLKSFMAQDSVVVDNDKYQR